MKETLYISVGEAARIMGLSEATVRQLADNKKIPAVKIGDGEKRKHYRIHRDAVGKVFADATQA